MYIWIDWNNAPKIKTNYTSYMNGGVHYANVFSDSYPRKITDCRSHGMRILLEIEGVKGGRWIYEGKVIDHMYILTEDYLGD